MIEANKQFQAPNVQKLQNDPDVQLAIAEFLIKFRVFTRLCFFTFEAQKDYELVINSAKSNLLKISLNKICKMPIRQRYNWKESVLREKVTELVKKLDLNESKTCEWAQRYLTDFYRINYSIWKIVIYRDSFAATSELDPTFNFYNPKRQLRLPLPTASNYKKAHETLLEEMHAMCNNSRFEKYFLDTKNNFLALLELCFIFFLFYKIFQHGVPVIVSTLVFRDIFRNRFGKIEAIFWPSPLGFSSASNLIQKSLIDEISQLDQQQQRPKKKNFSSSVPLESKKTPEFLPESKSAVFKEKRKTQSIYSSAASVPLEFKPLESKKSPKFLPEPESGVIKEKRKTQSSTPQLFTIIPKDETIILKWESSLENVVFPSVRGLIEWNRKGVPELKLMLNSIITRGNSSNPGIDAGCRNDYFLRMDESKKGACPLKAMTKINILIARGTIVPEIDHLGIVHESSTDPNFPGAKYKVKSLSKSSACWRVGLFKVCEKFSLTWEHDLEEPLPKNLTKANYFLYAPGVPKQTHT